MEKRISSHRLTKEERFLRKLKIGDENECWVWGGSKNMKGYGVIAERRVGIKTVVYMAHRVSYEMFVGEIPKGLVIDHLCNNTSCVNPKHLDPKTIYENAMRGFTGFKNLKKSSGQLTLLEAGVCRNGLHKINSSKDLYIYYSGTLCRECKQILSKKRYTNNTAGERERKRLEYKKRERIVL